MYKNFLSKLCKVKRLKLYYQITISKTACGLTNLQLYPTNVILVNLLDFFL